jgi:hypothetical protein
MMPDFSTIRACRDLELFQRNCRVFAFGFR